MIEKTKTHGKLNLDFTLPKDFVTTIKSFLLLCNVTAERIA